MNAIVTLNGTDVGTVTIVATKSGNSTSLKVKDDAVLTNPNGAFNSNDELTFTINDKRWSNYYSNWVDQTWTETLTVQLLTDGATIAFEY